MCIIISIPFFLFFSKYTNDNIELLINCLTNRPSNHMDCGILKKATPFASLKGLFFVSSAFLILSIGQANQFQQSTAQYSGNAEFQSQSNEFSENITLDNIQSLYALSSVSTSISFSLKSVHGSSESVDTPSRNIRSAQRRMSSSQENLPGDIHCISLFIFI